MALSGLQIYKLLARYRDGGYEALAPRSRRPLSCKHGTPREVVEAIVELLRRLAGEGHDCGAATIAYHLAKDMDGVPAPSILAPQEFRKSASDFTSGSIAQFLSIVVPFARVAAIINVSVPV